jgi:hypothetical protein
MDNLPTLRFVQGMLAAVQLKENKNIKVMASEMARNCRGLCPAVDCDRLIMMKVIHIFKSSDPCLHIY